jgi:hypothetical protein
MPPRKPTTRHSPRMKKMKEEEVVKGSTQRVPREPDFVSRTKSVICTATKKQFSQPLAFDYTKERIGSKVVLPHWGDLYRKISQEDYLEFTPHNNPNVRILDDQVLLNIKRSYLHKVAFWTLVLPCIKILGWIIDHTDIRKCMVKNTEGKCVGFFLPFEVQKYYKIKDP